MKRKRKSLKQLKTFVGRVHRYIQRQLQVQPLEVQHAFQDTLDKANRILNQAKTDKNKLYSFHAPEVECISKGKVHKKYEFDIKVGITVTNKSNFVLEALSFPDNPYDGFTLYSLFGTGRNSQWCSGQRAFCRLGLSRSRSIRCKSLLIETKTRTQHPPIKTSFKAQKCHWANHRRYEQWWFASPKFPKRPSGCDAMNAVICAAVHNIRLILRQLRIFWLKIWAAQSVISKSGFSEKKHAFWQRLVFKISTFSGENNLAPSVRLGL